MISVLEMRLLFWVPDATLTGVRQGFLFPGPQDIVSKLFTADPRALPDFQLLSSARVEQEYLIVIPETKHTNIKA